MTYGQAAGALACALVISACAPVPSKQAEQLTGREVGGISKVDVDAIRHREEGVIGLSTLLEQAWERYGQTIAVTECHLAGAREDQVRWFVEVWDAAEQLRGKGVDICAVTAWSLLGSYDWNRMVTCQDGHYETGVFDVRTGTPRPTLLASVLKELAAGNKPAFAGLSRPGWWRRSTRLIHAEQQSTPSFEIEPTEANQISEPPLLIAGGGGDLSALAIRACEMRGLPYVHCSEAEAEQLIVVVKPWAVLDVSDRDRVCSERDSMPRPKALLPIAAFCVAAGTPYAVITGAQSWHEVSHSAGVLEVRTHGVFVPWDRWARAVRMLEQLDQGRTVEIDPATSWTGVYGPDMIDGTLDLLFDGVTGAVDLRNRSQLSELDFARALAMVAEAPERLIQAEGSPAEQSLFSFSPPPSNLPPLSSMLERFVRECRCDCAIVGARYAAPAGSLVQAAE